MQIWQALMLVTLEQIKSEMERPTAYSAMWRKLKAKVWHRVKNRLFCSSYVGSKSVVVKDVGNASAAFNKNILINAACKGLVLTE